jgi:hypothetical protein
MKTYYESIMKCIFTGSLKTEFLNKSLINQSFKMVPGAGLEPARPYERGILNPLCLPISPPGQRGIPV